MKDLKAIILLAIGGLFFVACDTEESVEPHYEEYFVKYYGEEGSQEGVDIEILPDGYLLVGNSTPSGGNSAIFVVRTDILGNRISYGTISRPNIDLEVKDAVLDQNGRIYLLARMISSTGDIDMYLARTNLSAISGEIAPEIEFINDPAPDSFEDEPSSLTLVSDGDILITGNTTNIDPLKPEGTSGEDITDIISLRLSSDLVLRPETEWRRIYGQAKADYGHKVIEKNGGFLFYSSSFYSNDPAQQQGLNLMVFPTNQIGVVSGGYVTYGSSGNDRGSDIINTSEGGSLLIADSNNRMLITRLNSSNQLVQFPTAIGKESVKSKAVFEANRGGYFVAGNWSNLNNQDFYLAKVSVNNEVEWERTFGGLDQDDVSRVIQESDNSILIVGTIVLDSQMKMCLIKLNPNGDLKPLSN